MRGPKVATR
ncbi:unnamed protein product [Linum tenue]|uniref:Uncharacterized protein n=1 Tax=Linum tenue TaxID=586396 RepID=A0AAV0I3N7_9ROSI|nr:unnamed protein product [Linum tenue]CAI0540006.1 unnamed protein product [Linum tenue]